MIISREEKNILDECEKEILSDYINQKIKANLILEFIGKPYSLATLYRRFKKFSLK